jgi:glycosyltransferase involved in cell wall biosynthesis
MNLIKSKKESTVWMNVTTSANWSRPPVGIVRVEQALCYEIGKLLGATKFKQCVWSENEFIEWIPTDVNYDAQVEKSVDIIFPRTKSFDIPRRFLSRALSTFRSTSALNNCVPGDSSLPISLHFNGATKMRPSAGDILISVGLDWDQPYTSEFFNFSKTKNIKIITCCYDLIPVLFPQYCVGDVASRFKEYFNMLTWGSAAVLCISKQTQDDYLALCSRLGAPKRLTCILPLGDNVPTGIGEMSTQIDAVLAEPFILFVSTIERRKNHEVLYRAYHLLCRSGHRHLLPKLVFVGMPGWGVGDLLKDIELDPLTEGLIIQLNHVSDSELGELYKKALFCVYPSLYEGWGLPVGEALAVGKAVLASNQGSLPEVGGNLVRYLDPWNAEVWAAAMLELVKSPTLVEEMEKKVDEAYIARTWADAAKAVEQLIERLSKDDIKAEVVLYPGYDFSTQVGLHVGSHIQATGKEGFLLFGPHRSLAAGDYSIKVFDIPAHRSTGSLTVDMVGNSGGQCFWRGEVEIPDSEGNSKIEQLLLEFDVQLENDVEDFEIRCIIGSANLSLSRIIIKKLCIDSEIDNSFINSDGKK